MDDSGLHILLPGLDALASRSPNTNAHAEQFNRTFQEQFVYYHEDLLFDDLAAFNWNLAD